MSYICHTGVYHRKKVLCDLWCLSQTTVNLTSCPTNYSKQTNRTEEPNIIPDLSQQTDDSDTEQRVVESLRFAFCEVMSVCWGVWRKQEYETWKDMQKIETSYVSHRTICRKEHKIMYYDCNRSDLQGYKPNYKIMTEKAGGSIKIKGVCPSRLICKLRDQGQVSVSYWKTHAGHKEELRTMHLSKAEEKMVVEKLMAGVPPSRILKDSRKLETPQLDRLAVITTQDLTNLSTKYNIHKKRDQNDMVAAALKVQEWNANNKNYTFLFKKEDDAARCSREMLTIKSRHEEEINEFVRGKLEQTNVTQEKTKRSLQQEYLNNVLNGLDDQGFAEYMRKTQGILEEVNNKGKKITKKRKMET
ncbi:uncharacterized protein LOC126886513 isoform X2 [Diabrotica virgifera virgifera]|uniref:Uncharacterized protein n=1 Tax=Diabrotica virgifera virgifera TaxID=50390 RepID=A0ABM5KH27_DIAVI|nr:uncharacterized protein LOC126886513 isoform X2 [Diabrotica virgifera virgifera]